MNLQGKKVTVHDMTLRDGMHPKRHLMTLDQMKTVACGLDAAGVPLIEVTHGDGLGGRFLLQRGRLLARLSMAITLDRSCGHQPLCGS